MKYTAEEVREWAAFAQAQGKLYAPMKGAHEPWEKLEAMLTAFAERIKADEGAVVVAHRFIGPDGTPVTEWDDGLPDNRKTFPDLCPPVASVQYAYDRPPAQAAQVANIEAIREVIASHINEAKKLRHDPDSQDYLYEQADKLEAALQENGNGA